MLMYIVALAYAASSPMILPFTLAYFIVSWRVPHPRTQLSVESIKAFSLPGVAQLQTSYNLQMTFTGRACDSAAADVLQTSAYATHSDT